nr:hypothetical protein [Paenibacillus harenae]
MVGCFANARRKFDEVLKALPPSRDKTETVTQQGLQFCNLLFAFERELNDKAQKIVTPSVKSKVALF